MLTIHVKIQVINNFSHAGLVASCMVVKGQEKTEKNRSLQGKGKEMNFNLS